MTMYCTYHISNGVEYSVDPRSMSGGRYLSHTFIQLNTINSTDSNEEVNITRISQNSER